MRRLILLAGLALALGVLLPAGALPAPGGGGVPFKGTLTGPGSLNMTNGHLQATVTGEFNHLGRSTMVEDVQLVPTSPDLLHFTWNGTWVMTAADGAQLTGTCSGTGGFTSPTMSVSTWSIDFVSTGGTGRLAHATLAFHSNAVATTTAIAFPIAYADVWAPLEGSFSH
ncbi:MAG: hypothetical protein ACXVRJ_00340 [Gaiellaceae bacterium]